MKPYRDAVALVTGASSGIGRELARQMAPEASALVLVARRADRLQALAEELEAIAPNLRVLVRPTDLTDLTDCAAMIDEARRAVGPIDVLVNNAGFGDIGALDLADWDKLQRMIQLNVTALTYLSHRLYPGMVARGRGGILNVSSGFGLQFMPSFAAYVGTKHYVSGFTESLAIEARRLGVTVTQVCPGPVDTEFEEVAGNFTGRQAPALVRIGAAQCARESLRAFARGRARVIPGLFIRLVMFLGAWTPHWLLRLIHRPSAAWLRRRQLAGRRA